MANITFTYQDGQRALQEDTWHGQAPQEYIMLYQTMYGVHTPTSATSVQVITQKYTRLATLTLFITLSLWATTSQPLLEIRGRAVNTLSTCVIVHSLQVRTVRQVSQTAHSQSVTTVRL